MSDTLYVNERYHIFQIAQWAVVNFQIFLIWQSNLKTNEQFNSYLRYDTL